MSHPEYFPAFRTEARSLGLARLSVRTSDDRELGKLLGFVIDPRTHRSGASSWKWRMGRDRNKWRCRWCRCASIRSARRCDLIHTGSLPAMAFRPESVSQVEEDELWIPFIHSAAKLKAGSKARLQAQAKPWRKWSDVFA